MARKLAIVLFIVIFLMASMEGYGEPISLLNVTTGETVKKVVFDTQYDVLLDDGSFELTTEEYNKFLCNDQIPLLISRFDESNWHLSIANLNQESDLKQRMQKMADSNDWQLTLLYDERDVEVSLHKYDKEVCQGDVIINAMLKNHVLYTDRIVYRVAKGDTLSKIAAKYHITVQQIIELNDNLVEPEDIYSDMYLELPVTSTTSEIE